MTVEIASTAAATRTDEAAQQVDQSRDTFARRQDPDCGQDREQRPTVLRSRYCPGTMTIRRGRSGSMSRHDELRDYVAREAQDLFQAGRVGLYEFFDELRQFDELSNVEREAIARDAVVSLIETGACRLVWKVWADTQYEEPARLADITDVEWQVPTEQPYLAVEPI
ncbi:hypothetical protein [Jatrophihabitans endophyticus]|nr:hypothetical protein [Jatrophihabitans endophyticus]